MILVIGQVGRRFAERGAFQDMDCRAIFGGPSIVHVKVDSDAITPTTTLSALRAHNLAT